VREECPKGRGQFSLRRERRPHRAGREKGSRGVFGVENWNSWVIVESMSELVSELRVVSEELRSFLASATGLRMSLRRSKPLRSAPPKQERLGVARGWATSLAFTMPDWRRRRAGAHFSSEWGLKQLYYDGHARHIGRNFLRALSRRRSGGEQEIRTLRKRRTLAEKGQGLFERGRDSVTSILQTCVGNSRRRISQEAAGRGGTGKGTRARGVPAPCAACGPIHEPGCDRDVAGTLDAATHLPFIWTLQ
jgi:hypothetical protein